MRKYELMLTLPGTLDDQEVRVELSKVVEEVKKFIEGNIETIDLGKIRLAYPMKQIRYGYYFTLIFSAQENKMPELDRQLRMNKGILRAIINIFSEYALNAMDGVLAQVFVIA